VFNRKEGILPRINMYYVIGIINKQLATTFFHSQVVNHLAIAIGTFQVAKVRYPSHRKIFIIARGFL